MKDRMKRVCTATVAALLVAGCSSPTVPRLPDPGEPRPPNEGGQTLLVPVGNLPDFHWLLAKNCATELASWWS